MTSKTLPSALRTHIGYHLRAVSNAVSQSFARKLADSDVTVAEWVILREMYDGKGQASPSDIAKLTGLTRGAVSKLIERLLNKKLVTRISLEHDRRYQQIELTDKALKQLPKLAKIADENDDTFFSVLPENERKSLKQTLIKLAELHRLKTHPIE